MPSSGIEALRARIRASGVPRRADGKLRIARWNIRELGRRARRPESLAYIAAILSWFDVIAVVELREDLRELEVILRMLGPRWRALFTAPIYDAGGNRERAAYLYDSEVIQHTGLASSAQAPRTKQGAEYLAAIGWWRAPFFASFVAGDTHLLLLTAHVRWGERASERSVELALLADWVVLELAKDPYTQERDIIVLGDFNIPSRESALMDTKAVQVSSGFDLISS